MNDYLEQALKHPQYLKLVKRRTIRYGSAFGVSLIALLISVFAGFEIPAYFVLSFVSALMGIFFGIFMLDAMKKPSFASAGVIEDVRFRARKVGDKKIRHHYEYLIKGEDGKGYWARCIDSKDALDEQTKAPGEKVLFFLYAKDDCLCISLKED